MHPAYSVLIFTTSAGAGYGLLFWLVLVEASGRTSHTHWSFFFTLMLALALITIGLLSSTFHLGHPERAWRAFSQWRSSWLSREGVAALATYVPAGLLALLSLLKIDSGVVVLLDLLAAIGAVVTVWCTGMIYASLRTIRQWNMRLVPAIYLALSATSGALLLELMNAAYGITGGWEVWLTLACLQGAQGLKRIYFRRIDGEAGRYTAAMALGMGENGIRQIDPPHTRPNYVMREMGYEVGRRHAVRLRRWMHMYLFVVPTMWLALLVLSNLPPLLLLVPATIFAAVGLFVERWLFFAEAEHVSMLYYGKDRA
ncbi:MAG: dimethyl sulfoxide reductase anchor subunit [Rhodobacteraceae bacterium]|nr:dimethyl sulfoxide reductase anchor subunit [Paracoccaceae bacterium]